MLSDEMKKIAMNGGIAWRLPKSSGRPHDLAEDKNGDRVY